MQKNAFPTAKSTSTTPLASAGLDYPIDFSNFAAVRLIISIIFFSSMSNTLKTERIQWVDAMRGFSMIVVVFGHVMLSMGLGGYDSFLNSILLTFRMPLFFFVSGFFSYRVLSWWTKNRVLDILKRKVQAQVICTFAFLSLFLYVTEGKVTFEYGLCGYWFTIVLFQMYILYLLLALLSRLIHCKIVFPGLVVLSLLGIACLALYHQHFWAWDFFNWMNLCKYLQFFTLGLFCSKHRTFIFRILGSNLFRLIIIVGWTACMILWYNAGFKTSFPIIYSFIHDIAVRYFALSTVVMLFYSARDFYSKDSRTSSTLKFIGQRTLDIYMIHYFFIPNLSFLKEWLNNGNMLVLQLIVALIITSVIVMLCLLISSILRKTTYLQQWLFGVRPRPANKDFVKYPS